MSTDAIPLPGGWSVEPWGSAAALRGPTDDCQFGARIGADWEEVRVFATAIAAEVERLKRELAEADAALIGLRAWMPPGGQDPAIDAAMKNADRILAARHLTPDEIGPLNEADARELLAGAALLFVNAFAARHPAPGLHATSGAVGAGYVPDELEATAPRWRHKKRGTTYAELGRAEYQWSTGSSIGEGDVLVIYRSEQDGRLWAREQAEFDDGRFERLPPAPVSPEAQS